MALWEDALGNGSMSYEDSASAVFALLLSRLSDSRPEVREFSKILSQEP